MTVKRSHEGGFQGERTVLYPDCRGCYMNLDVLKFMERCAKKKKKNTTVRQFFKTKINYIGLHMCVYVCMCCKTKQTGEKNACKGKILKASSSILLNSIFSW